MLLQGPSVANHALVEDTEKDDSAVLDTEDGDSGLSHFNDSGGGNDDDFGLAQSSSPIQQWGFLTERPIRMERL